MRCVVQARRKRFKVEDLKRFKVQDLGVRILGSGLRVEGWGQGFRVHGFRGWDVGFRV